MRSERRIRLYDVPHLKSESGPELRRETEFGYKVVPIKKKRARAGIEK